MNGSGPFVMSDTLSWSDIILASELSWFRAAWGEDSTEWKDIMSWHEGRWETFLENMKEYETVI
jgi:glutathione S-transferase